MIFVYCMHTSFWACVSPALNSMMWLVVSPLNSLIQMSSTLQTWNYCDMNEMNKVHDQILCGCLSQWNIVQMKLLASACWVQLTHQVCVWLPAQVRLPKVVVVVCPVINTRAHTWPCHASSGMEVSSFIHVFEGALPKLAVFPDMEKTCVPDQSWMDGQQLCLSGICIIKCHGILYWLHFVLITSGSCKAELVNFTCHRVILWHSRDARPSVKCRRAICFRRKQPMRLHLAFT